MNFLRLPPLRCRAFHTSSSWLTRSTEKPPRTFRSPGYVGTVTALSIGTLASLYFFLPDVSRGAPTLKDASLSPTHFTPCTITASEPCGPNSRLITVAIPPKALPSTTDELSPSFSSIWSVFIKDDDIQVERPYTPLEGLDEEGKMRFWIKQYPRGEVARWLNSKNVGEEIEVRGPLQTWLWRDMDWDHVVMISGGTGITPFYQLFHSVISRLPSTHRTRFTLLHSSRIPSELPPPAILDPLITYAKANPERLNLQLCIDSYGSSREDAPHLDLRLGRIDKSLISKALGIKESVGWWPWNLFSRPQKIEDEPKVLFLVCGPEPMIGAIAGPYGRNFSQGAVGGVLAELGYTSNEVHKL
ncbi:ferredoxin reductase-like protein [Dendrothele bispora CBS 962.96]|uniref:Ferredoxin reductase-like protein n=1 Tax=Dendrothele bispora (strain CBS 962.96) TaxID=1314807 RepID=A0A4S8MQX4_DENBC|nr:ferredoxin reductase-like protein [Dendrothele bispora CBS 962.96]